MRSGSCVRVVFAQNLLLILDSSDVLEVMLISIVGCQVVFVEGVPFYFGSRVPEDNVKVLFMSNFGIVSEMSSKTSAQARCGFVELFEFGNIVLWIIVSFSLSLISHVLIFFPAFVFIKFIIRKDIDLFFFYCTR